MHGTKKRLVTLFEAASSGIFLFRTTERFTSSRSPEMTLAITIVSLLDPTRRTTFRKAKSACQFHSLSLIQVWKFLPLKFFYMISSIRVHVWMYTQCCHLNPYLFFWTLTSSRTSSLHCIILSTNCWCNFGRQMFTIFWTLVTVATLLTHALTMTLTWQR